MVVTCEQVKRAIWRKMVIYNCHHELFLSTSVKKFIWLNYKLFNQILYMEVADCFPPSVWKLQQSIFVPRYYCLSCLSLLAVRMITSSLLKWRYTKALNIKLASTTQNQESGVKWSS